MRNLNNNDMKKKYFIIGMLLSCTALTLLHSFSNRKNSNFSTLALENIEALSDDNESKDGVAEIVPIYMPPTFVYEGDKIINMIYATGEDCAGTGKLECHFHLDWKIY